MNNFNEIIAEYKKIPWFHELNDKHLRKIAEITTLRHVRTNETLFREGDKADFIYIVLEGRVALDIFVPHKGKIRFYTAESPELFGWSSVTPTVRQRTAGAIAVMDGLLACIDAAKLQQACDEDHDLGYLVMHRLANIVASRLQVTRMQLIDMFAYSESKNE